MCMGGDPAGSSGTQPGASLIETFHFLAEPAPQCCSQAVGWKSCGAGMREHSVQPQRILSVLVIMLPCGGQRGAHKGGR
jgi:hypothetical protein